MTPSIGDVGLKITNCFGIVSGGGLLGYKSQLDLTFKNIVWATYMDVQKRQLSISNLYFIVCTCVENFSTVKHPNNQDLQTPAIFCQNITFRVMLQWLLENSICFILTPPAVVCISLFSIFQLHSHPWMKGISPS